MEDMDLMEVTRYAIVQWEDKLTSVISLHNIKLPRKSVTEYIEGEYVTALYGKKQYRARISEINEDRHNLVKKDKGGQFPLQFTFEEPAAEGTTLDDLATSDDTARQTVTETHEKQQQSSHTSVANESSDPLAASGNATPEKQNTEAAAGGSSISDVSTAKIHTPTESSPTLPTVSVTSISSHSSKRKLDQLEKDMKELKGSLKAVKRRVKELEEHSGTRSPDLSLSAASEETNSFDGLMRTVSHLSGTSDKEINAVIRDLTMKLFSKEDLRNCTRTGKKTNKTGDAPKPALDNMKLTLLERVVRTKSPSVTNELFKKKLDNILKMERRASMKQQDLV